MSTRPSQELLHPIHDAIQALREEPLYDWVVVALWNGPTGDVSVYGEAPPLHLKSYLHSGVWQAAHQEPDEPQEPDLIQKSLDSAADVRSFEKGRMDVVKIAGSSIGRGTFEPGWRWSRSVGPMIGASECPLAHTGFVVQGRMKISMTDGHEFEVAAGEAIHIAPGHDAWTVGDEPCVILEVLSAAEYAQPSA